MTVDSRLDSLASINRGEHLSSDQSKNMPLVEPSRRGDSLLYRARVGIQFFRVSHAQISALAIMAVVSGVFEVVAIAMIVEAATALSAHRNVVQVSVLGARTAPLTIEAFLFVALGAVLLRTVTQLVTAYVPVRLTASVAAGLRKRLIDDYLSADWTKQAAGRQGLLTDLVGNQCEQASSYVGNLVGSLAAFLNFLTLALLAVTISPIAFVGIAVVGGALYILLRPVTKAGERRSAGLSAASQQLAGDVEVIVGMAEEITTFNVRDVYSASACTAIEQVRRGRLAVDFLGRILWSAYQNVALALIVAALFLVALRPETSLTSFGAVVLILMRALVAGQVFQSSYHQTQQLWPFVQRLRAVVQDLEDRRETRGAEQMPSAAPVQMRSVGFRYPAGPPVLSGVCLDVAKGEVIGIIGKSGAGKSTLVQLLVGLRFPEVGEYLVAGVPVPRYSADEWARNVAYVPQETRIVTASILDNIRFGRSIEDAKLEDAARAAAIHEDILKLPLGYATRISHRTEALSGGQRQRLCLARALAGEPQLLVLDEPTSALDSVTEQAICSMIDRLRGRVTVVVVAHREAILRVCDRILTVDAGTVSAAAMATSALLPGRCPE